MFKDSLKQLMNSKKLSRAQIIAMTGVSKASLSGYLSGANEPSRTRKQEIAEALGVSADYFFQPAAMTMNIDDVVSNDRGLSVREAAEIMGKSPAFVQLGLQQGRFSVGICGQDARLVLFH